MSLCSMYVRCTPYSVHIYQTLQYKYLGAKYVTLSKGKMFKFLQIQKAVIVVVVVVAAGYRSVILTIFDVSFHIVSFKFGGAAQQF